MKKNDLQELRRLFTSRNASYLSIAIVTSLLGACSYHPVPYETIRPQHHQLDMEAAEHWNQLAEQVAANIQAHLPHSQADTFVAPPMSMELPTAIGADPLADLPPGTLPPPGPVPEPTATAPAVIQLDLSDPNLSFPTQGMGSMSIASTAPVALNSMPQNNTRPVLYINPPRSGFETPFAYGFHDLLRSHLVQKGVAVTTQPNTVNTHCTNAMFCRPMVLNYNVDTLEHKDRWHVYEPRTEVIVNTSVSDGDLVVFSRSDIYYINPGDQDHYVRGTRSLKVVDK